MRLGMKLRSSAAVESHDARIGGNESRRGRLRPGGDDRLVEAHDPRALRSLDPQSVGRGEPALSITVFTLRCLARPLRPPVRRLTKPSFQPRTAARSKVGAPKLTPCEPIALASSMTLATCKSALERNAADIEADAAKGRARINQNNVLPQIGGAEGGGVAAGTGAQNQNIGLEIGRLSGSQ